VSELIRLETRRSKRYKTIFLEATEDPRLSWKAKGLHTYLMSRPPGWEIHYHHLASCSTDGKSSLGSAVKELSALGYLRIEKEQGESGHFSGSKWVLTESPMTMPIGESPYPDYPDTDYPDTDYPDTDNGTISKKQEAVKNTNKKNPSVGEAAARLGSRCDTLMEYLNQATERSGVTLFRSYGGLRERLKDGVADEDVRLVIDFKRAQWGHDERMRAYIRPKTLFGKENFPGYLDEARGWDARGRPSFNGDRPPTQNPERVVLTRKLEEARDRLRLDFENPLVRWENYSAANAMTQEQTEEVEALERGAAAMRKQIARIEEDLGTVERSVAGRV